jgi:hypothetical protein
VVTIVQFYSYLDLYALYLMNVGYRRHVTCFINHVLSLKEILHHQHIAKYRLGQCDYIIQLHKSEIVLNNLGKVLMK